MTGTKRMAMAISVLVGWHIAVALAGPGGLPVQVEEKTGLTIQPPFTPPDITHQLEHGPEGWIEIVSPRDDDLWYWHISPRVEWKYHWNSAARPEDTVVTLWKDDARVQEVEPAVSVNGHTSVKVPEYLPVGEYSLHVTHANDYRIEHRHRIRVWAGKVSFTAPGRNAVWTSGTQQTVKLTYEGNPSPLNLVLADSYGSKIADLASGVNLTPGEAWQRVTVPTVYRDSRYVIQARPTNDPGRVVGRSELITIPSTPEECNAHIPLSVSWNEKVAIPGERLNESCAAELIPGDGSTVVPLTIVSKKPQELTVEIPTFTPLGSGTLRVYPKSGQNEGSSRQVTVKSSNPNAEDCEVFAVQTPAGTKPGDEIILWGNHGMSGACKVKFLLLQHFVGAVPEVYPVQAEPLGSYRLKVKIPMMPPGVTSVTSSAGPGSPTTGVGTALNVVAIPPVLLSVTPDSGRYGDRIHLTGRAFLPPQPANAYQHQFREDLVVRVFYGDNDFVDLTPSHTTLPNQTDDVVVVQLPKQVSSVGKCPYRGKVLMYRGNPSLSSASLDFTIKAHSSCQ